MIDHFVIENNLSIAWAKTFLRIRQSPGRQKTPFIVRITKNEGKLEENQQIKELLNSKLGQENKFNINTVASTIFPSSFWNKNLPREQLFLRYNKNWNKIKKYSQNRNGTYFQRLISYNCLLENDSNINQLEEIITTWKNNIKRRSALQASIYDPRMDHKQTPYQGFPCLQQVAFNPMGNNGEKGLEIIGFYATQTVLEKAYGNYLGLWNLGEFMANEMGLEFIQMTCMSSLLKLTNGRIPSEVINEITERIKKIIP